MEACTVASVIVANSEAETTQRSPQKFSEEGRAFRRRRHFDACVIDCVRLCVQGTGYFYGLTSKLLDAALPFQTINLISGAKDPKVQGSLSGCAPQPLRVGS